MKRLGALVAALVVIAAPASAHVEVSPDTAPRGGAAILTFNVEDERDSADMVVVEFYLPVGLSADTITPTAPAGWDYVFTIDPGSVRFRYGLKGRPGDQSFTLAIDPLPNASTLVFKTVVEYDNGDIDRWIDLKTGTAEPPHPAPVVKLTRAGQPTRATLTTVKRPDKGSNRGGIAGVLVGALVVVALLVRYALRKPRPR